MFSVEAVQKALSDGGLAGWLFYQFRGLDPVADRVLRLLPGRMATRRWFYWVPASGEPVH